MYNIKEASEYLGVNPETLRRWEREGKKVDEKNTTKKMLYLWRRRKEGPGSKNFYL